MNSEFPSFFKLSQIMDASNGLIIAESVNNVEGGWFSFNVDAPRGQGYLTTGTA